MNQPNWIATTTRLPADGQAVLVKTLHGRVEHRVTLPCRARGAMGESVLHHATRAVRVLAPGTASAGKTDARRAHCTVNLAACPSRYQKLFFAT